MVSMVDTKQELIRESFIDPIRFALVVDDRFARYDAAPSSEEDQRVAKSLFRFCRNNGWLCDVDDGQFAAALRKPLQQSDLLILDFHLDRTKANDPTRALHILQDLANSDHFNLVIIYTADDKPARVALDIAFSLGAGALVPESRRDEAVDYIDENDHLRNMLNDAMLAEFLRERKPAQAFRSLRQDVRTAGAKQNDVLRLLVQERFEASIPEEVRQRRALGRAVSFKAEGEIPWVKSGNVFVTVANKATDADQLLKRLLDALCDWDPSPLEMMMVKVRSAMAQAGALHDQDILADRFNQAGWMLKMLVNEDHPREIRHLYARLLERFSRVIGQRVAEFGSKALKRDGRPPLEQALEWARLPAETSPHEVYLAVNEYLCSEPCETETITTGVVFKGGVKGEVAYWLCTSPACDLVPGQNTSGWDGLIHPIRAINAIALRPIRNSDPVQNALKEATYCRYIFVRDGSERIVLEVADGASRQVKPELILINSEGRFDKGEFTGFLIRKTKRARKPRLEAAAFAVVASLRSDYANRYLMEFGQQKTRIGVDYIDLPT